jgi:hypothetical protein
MTKDEALKLALEALETELCIDWTNNDEFNASAEKMHEAIAAIKEALAQPEQEAVGSVVTYYDSLTHGWFGDPPPEGTLLYIVPPQPEERNFCQRCGKPVNLTTIHTCTPPQGNT